VEAGVVTGLGPLVHEEPPAWGPMVAEVVEGCLEVVEADAGDSQVIIRGQSMKLTPIYILSKQLFRAGYPVVLCGLLTLVLYGAPQEKQTTPAPPPVVQKAFATPEQAAEALIQAAQQNDVDALLQIFGPDGKDLVSTDDHVQDKNARASFVERAQVKKFVERDLSNPNRAILSIGEFDWPLPVPIIKKDGKWRFDSIQGRQELLNRRIGSNELDVIDICLGFVEAQREFASMNHDNSGQLQYAQRIISSPGKQDGLFWRNPDGSSAGPIGETIAKALAEGYTSKADPYHGYFFKVLKRQGPAAPLGEMDYVVNGAMIGGFALVAWPAEHRVTGVKTFMVNHDGIVYQKDLGPETAKIASSITSYNPDKTWHRTDDQW